MTLSTKASRMIHKVGFEVKKHSPEILVAAGIVGTVASTVMACKATMKVEQILLDKKEKEEQINMVFNDEQYEYTEEDKVKDLTIVYTQTGVKLFKLYAPAVILGGVSIGCIVAGHNILRKRNLALAAAYAVVDKGFKQYRKNVVDRFGEELDKELRYNIKTTEVEKITKDEKGKEKVEKETVKIINPEANVSEYARFYDCGNKGWEKDPELNLMFLRRQEDYANDLLRNRGYLFLNEVYDMLGIPRTRAGQVVGWIYKGKDTDTNKPDSYVDFGVYDINRESCRNFVNGHEATILLDFNVDGPITNILPE